MVVLVAVLMFFSSAMSANAKGRSGRWPQPTEEPVVEPVPEMNDEKGIPEEEVEEEAEEEVVQTAEEAPAEEPEEEIVIESADFSAPISSAFDDVISTNADGDETTREQATTNDLNLQKSVTSNGDGTYKITLSITGATESSTHTETTSANVVVVLDKSSSMTQTLSSGVTRLQAVTDAAKLLIDAMPNAAKVDMLLLSFGGSVSNDSGGWVTIDSDSVKTTLKGKLPTSTDSGTDWPEALTEAYSQASTKKAAEPDEPMFVIFLTDGCPSRPEAQGHSHGQDGTQLITDTCISNALTQMENMVNAEYTVYGIYANVKADKYRPYSGSAQNPTYTGDDDPLQYILRVSGAGVDGHYYQSNEASELEAIFEALAKEITDSLSYSDAGIEDGVTPMSNTSASTSVSGDVAEFEYKKDGVEWTDAPEAKFENNAVVWDLSSIGDLEDGVTYTVSFDVWPSQEAYDLVADLNNGLKDYDELTDAEKAQIGGEGPNGYYLLTNTYLKSTYTHNNTEYYYDGDEGSSGMALAAETISLEKLWPENMLDSYGAATYRDEDGNEQTATSIKLTLVKDTEDYLDVTVDKDNGWKRDNVYVSCGLMTVKNGKVTIKEPGYDYTVTEPEGFSYYWDLYADIYHPMVINGTATMLVLDEDATSADNENTFEINGKFYTKGDANDVLQASNYRRSNLNLTKVVSTEGGYDGYFTYTAKVTDTNSTDGYVWFSAWDPEAGATVKDTDWVTGATAEEGNTGYWYADNGSTVTLKIKAGWNVRFLNLYHGTTFEFEETDMPDYYEFEKVEAAAKYAFMDKDIKDSDWYTISNKKVSGNVIEANNSYTVTYTNKYAAFYIYHSGVDKDGNLEIIPMTDVKEDGTYDLYAKTTAGTLYGGYYLDYSGKGSYADDGVAKEDGVKYTGMNYNDWSGAQTVSGKAITPVAGETYYIKEVPTYYLRNYHQINYLKKSLELKALYLMSAVDDLNYEETGFTITGTNKKATKVISSMAFRNYATGKSVTLKADTVFNRLGITEAGEYLTYFNATNTEYFAEGEFTVLPYWITPDKITVNGISTRTITITKLTKDGITKKDS